MEDKENKSFWCIITAPVLYSKELSDKSKILFGVISNLTKQKGYCYAHNSTLAEELGWSERTIQYSIKELEDCGFISREIEFIDKQVSGRKIYVLPVKQTSPGPGSMLHGGHEAACTHNIVTNEVNKLLINNKSRKRTPKKIDPQHKEASATYELESLARWNELTRLWFTGENPHGLKGTYRKYFLDLGTEGQESLLNIIRSFGDDTRYLFNVWIGMTFKQDCMNKEFLQDAIENAKEIEKRKTPTKTGQYKKPSFFGNE